MSSKDKSGFTLLEVMVAMLITLVGLLGLLQSLNIATEHTRKNQLRDEAIRIAEEQLNVLRAKNFDGFDTFSTLTINSKQSSWTYEVERSRSPLSATSKQLRIKVIWSYKNVPTDYELLTIVSQP